MVSARFEFQFSAEEQDAGAVVREVTEAAGVRLDQLNAAVEAFRRCVADRVAEPAQDVFQTALQHAGHAFHRLQT